MKITNECINCDACIDECPAIAIVSADDAPLESEYTYVKPEKCIECVDAAVPKCADVCPTPEAIVWDMPYIPEYESHFVDSNAYAIRVHKKKGMMTPSVSPQAYRESISIDVRQASTPVGQTLRLQ